MEPSEQAKKIVTRKLKKACKTRWLSFDASVASALHNICSLILVLQEFKDPTSAGLLVKIKTPKFIGTLYILADILPILSQVSRLFQRSSITYCVIQPALQHAQQALDELVRTGEPVKKFFADISSKLATLDLTIPDTLVSTLEKLLKDYVSAIKENLSDRFDGELDVIKNFDIFNPKLLDALPGTEEFRLYGEEEINNISKELFKGVEDFEAKLASLKAEWSRFKFDWWAADKVSTIDQCLQKLLTNHGATKVYMPTLSMLAEIYLSAPITNAWPERGVSAMKRNKTRLRSRLGNKMLQSLLMVVLNGPDSLKCRPIAQKAIEIWKEKKKRRKLPAPPKASQSSGQVTDAQPVTLQDVGVQCTPVNTDTSSVNKLMELVGLDSECESEHEDFCDSDADSIESEDDYYYSD